MKRLISEEALSDTGIHIATGVLVDKVVSGVLGNKYDNWYINIYTLVRNFINCIDGNVDSTSRILKSSNGRKEIVKELIDDINLILSTVSSRINVVIYNPNYKKLRSKLATRDLDSLKGLRYLIAKYEDDIIKEIEKGLDISLLKRDHTLPYAENTLITTHIVVDLLNFINKKHIGLFESHTGDIKEKDRWYRKIYQLPKKDMSIIPFTPRMLFIFGDKVLVKPMNIKIRLKIYDLATKHHWSPITSESRAIYDIGKKDKILEHEIKDLPKIYR